MLCDKAKYVALLIQKGSVHLVSTFRINAWPEMSLLSQQFSLYSGGQCTGRQDSRFSVVVGPMQLMSVTVPKQA